MMEEELLKKVIINLEEVLCLNKIIECQYICELCMLYFINGVFYEIK